MLTFGSAHVDKDIRFTDKKVDDVWKDQAARDKAASESRAEKKEPSNETAGKSKPSAIFFNFISSLGYQAMMHLGEMPNPATQKIEVNLEAGKEIIDLLIEFKVKSSGNATNREKEFFDKVLPELQLRYTQKV